MILFKIVIFGTGNGLSARVPVDYANPITSIISHDLCIVLRTELNLDLLN